MNNLGTDILLGIAIGDALGVPYEFSERDEMKRRPARDMEGFMVHHQPPGTWSDDSSLTFCLAEAIVEGYELQNVATKFVKWRNEAYWTARNSVFDIGMTTNRAISRLERILANRDLEKLEALKENADEQDNGNGSLMRILPLVFELKGKNNTGKFEIVWHNSALTHRHIRAAMSCYIYLELAEKLINGIDKQQAYQETRLEIQSFWNEIDFPEAERVHFQRIIQNDANKLKEGSIKSGGYVIESLEASIWCLLKTDTFEEAVLKAINFGHDTDTTAAITGGLAGILYTQKSMPEYWIASLARMEDILELGNKLNEKAQSL